VVRRPTIRDVAERAGVSKGAVSFALNGRPGVAPATRDRILDAASELGWRPSSRARALVRARADALGLVLSRQPELLGADPFFAQFLAGVETALAGRGMALILQVVTAAGDAGVEAESASYRRIAAEGRADGVFLTDLRVDDPRIPLLVELGLPAVVVGQPVGDCPFPAVVVDDRVGVADAVAHLLALGHRRIAFVGGTEGYVHSLSRRAAWRGALEAAGVAPGPELAGDFTGPGGAAATRALLDLRERPTAIVFANDLMAVAGMGVALGAGLAVPDDLSIVGFDDIPLAAHVVPALTTVRQDAQAWGRAAAEALLALTAAGDACGQREPVGDVRLDPSQLVIRSSTTSPRGSTSHQPRTREAPQ
jgi:DNA-binding LacI/PurR family transcriptional regulator